jgi:hypothetical protein
VDYRVGRVWAFSRDRDTVEALYCSSSFYLLVPLSHANPNPKPQLNQSNYCFLWRKRWRLITIISSLTIYSRDAPLSNQRLLLLNGSKNGNFTNSLIFTFCKIIFLSFHCYLFWVSDLGAKILDFFVQAMLFSFLLALLCLVSLEI